MNIFIQTVSMFHYQNSIQFTESEVADGWHGVGEGGRLLVEDVNSFFSFIRTDFTCKRFPSIICGPKRIQSSIEDDSMYHKCSLSQLKQV